MRTILLGGTDFSIAIADAMREISMPPIGVVGIGESFKVSYSPAAVPNVRGACMADWCEANGVAHIDTTDNGEIAEFAAQLDADLCIVAGWYHMVPGRLRARFANGCLGIHASMLPELRGGAPLNWAILNGLSRTGVTLFELTDGVDDGPIYDQVTVPIGARTSVTELVESARQAACDLVRACLPKIAQGALCGKPQAGAASYGLQRIPQDGRIDWNRPVIEIDRLIRAVTRPYLGATTELNGEPVTVWKAQPVTAPTVYGAHGQVARVPESQWPCVVAGDGLLAIHEATSSDGADALPRLFKANHMRLPSN
jgi:methionyl-tRNA formyltransferase